MENAKLLPMKNPKYLPNYRFSSTKPSNELASRVDLDLNSISYMLIKHTHLEHDTGGYNFKN